MQEFHVFFVLPWRLVHKEESHFKYMKQKETQLVLDSAAGHFEKKENKYGVYKIPWALERERQTTRSIYLRRSPLSVSKGLKMVE